MLGIGWGTTVLVGAWLATHGATARHPLHTSFTEVKYRAGGTIEVSVRVFHDDFASALARHSEPRSSTAPPISDSLALAYLEEHLLLLDHEEHRLVLTWVASDRAGDLDWITLRASVPARLDNIRVLNTVHFELFRDQVNVVKLTSEDRSESVLFTRGDTPKPWRLRP